MRLLTALALVLVLVLAAEAAGVAASPPAQTAKAAAPQALPATPAAPVAPSAPPSAPPSAQPFETSFIYSPEGRRDPFQSLVGRGGDSKTTPKPTVAGIAGIRVDELSVRGIMQSREKLVAMVKGPDNRTYLIRQGDKLADGVVKSVTPQGLLLVQDVSEPRATEKTREVRKPLRSSEDEKE